MLVKLGPYTPDNNPPTFAEGADLIASGTFDADDDFRSNNPNVVVVSRVLNSRIFLFVISLASTETVEIPGSVLRDVYSGTLHNVILSSGLRRVNVSLTSPATLLQVYEWQS